MKIIFDLDNTITDEFGSTIRPGIITFIEKLKADGHSLVLWTNSTKDRAKKIIYEHDIKKYFDKCIFREDYDKNNEGIMKDIALENADYIIDDDPNEVKYNKNNNKKGYIITPFRKGKNVDINEYDKIYNEIKKI